MNTCGMNSSCSGYQRNGCHGTSFYLFLCPLVRNSPVWLNFYCMVIRKYLTGILSFFLEHVQELVNLYCFLFLGSDLGPALSSTLCEGSYRGLLLLLNMK